MSAESSREEFVKQLRAAKRQRLNFVILSLVLAMLASKAVYDEQPLAFILLVFLVFTAVGAARWVQHDIDYLTHVIENENDDASHRR